MLGPLLLDLHTLIVSIRYLMLRKKKEIFIHVAM